MEAPREANFRAEARPRPDVAPVIKMEVLGGSGVRGLVGRGRVYQVLKASLGPGLGVVGESGMVDRWVLGGCSSWREERVWRIGKEKGNCKLDEWMDERT